MKHPLSTVLVCALVTLTLLLAACGTATPSPTTPPLANTPSSPEPYPAPGNEPTSDPNIHPFRLDTPLLPGATKITGSGTPGVPVLVLDITTMGTLVGEATIQADGTFSMEVAPLEKEHRLGVTIGNLDGTQWKLSDFENRAYFGENAHLVPQVGFFYDTASVR